MFLFQRRRRIETSTPQTPFLRSDEEAIWEGGTSSSYVAADLNSGVESVEPRLGRPTVSRSSSHGIAKIPDATLMSIQRGSNLQELVNKHGEDVIGVLKDVAVVKLGSFRARDADVVRAFGSNEMLTTSRDAIEDPQWRANWKEVIHQRCKNRKRTDPGSWETTLRLSAYAVQIKDIGKPERGDLIALLRQKTASASLPEEIWTYPAVRAVIEHHWQHWARRLLFCAFLLFLSWTLCFAAYVCIYITSKPFGDEEDSQPPSNVDVNIGRYQRRSIESPNAPRNLGSTVGEEWRYGSFSADLKETIITYVLVVSSTFFMLPFAFQEIWLITVQWRHWFSWRHLLDISVISLQSVIFFCHLLDCGIKTEIFGFIIALQIGLLSIRILRFFSLLGEGSTFLHTALAVVRSVRWWIAYIIYIAVVAGLCLGALYETDYAFQSQHAEFRTFSRSIATAVQVVFGGFDADYIFESDYPYLKALVFFVFELVMPITFLNLLIAAMSESYLTVTQHREVRRYRGRAFVIDELTDLLLPHWIIPDTRTYIHFLVVEEQEEQNETSLDGEVTLEAQAKHIVELKEEVKELSAQIRDIASLLRYQAPSRDPARS